MCDFQGLLTFRQLEPKWIDFRALQRSIHTVCWHRSTENRAILAKIGKMPTASNNIRIKEIDDESWIVI